ncbi:MAG: hypothetical protein J6Q73_03805 [Bacteroidaceae bacterium]|nr:hypothetical protein [Bacteroidaceae bacterium]
MNKRNTILILVALLLLMTIAGELLLAVLFPGYVGKAHLTVPVFFFVLYAVPVVFMTQPVDAKLFIKQFMIFKSLKLALSLGALLAMAFIFKEQAKGVLVNFLIYALVMLVIENMYVLKLKKQIVKGTK